MGYSFRLAARVLLYASSHRHDNTYHGLCYTSRGGHTVKDHSDSERGNMLPSLHRLLFPFSNKGTFTCTIRKHLDNSAYKAVADLRVGAGSGHPLLKFLFNPTNRMHPSIVSLKTQTPVANGGVRPPSEPLQRSIKGH